MHRILALLGFVLLLTQPAAAQVDIGFGGVAFDDRQPVEVTADGLTLDQTTGEAIFTGNVIVVQGDLRMAAGAVRIVYGTQGNQDVSEVIATGGVLVTRGADAAEGGSARYDVASALLTLSGNVLVTQGPTAISGDSMVVNMRAGNGSVDGRVRTVLGGTD
ncbi:lipopolysaccharide transport periplasmic protein LptA [Rhodobacteraceae bacterium N5(2021)]|uniref:Lipopolysaccharide transport periplasmic protein LptA n=1 Tax=Gymnodinialimonas phycosphaerae TaxID=2841589 RepID=A0A975TST1_9RHOB|nr:LptA/OstA family protein [Gymnodinialimonas phycosphaerae]MBY4894297.1 lipopolysaccharide transport periplasmic protein LptA [Gymnodinialimonas phycosphaerae]